jgi:hypothetical protein
MKEIAIISGSLMVAVGVGLFIWAIKQIRKNYYKPKSTRSTYRSKKAKHKADVSL